MKIRRDIKLAQNLRTLMRARGLSITFIAKQTGMNKSTLHNYCNGVIPRNLIKLKDLADLLGVPFSALLFGDEISNPVELASFESLEGRFEVTVRRIRE